MKTVTLHIGNPKTGTSSIQKTLSANRKLLERKGLLYPLELPATGRFRRWGTGSHRWLTPLVEPDRERWPRSIRARISESEMSKAIAYEQKSFSRMLKRVQRSQAQHIVISSETLGSLQLDAIQRLKELLDPLDAHVKVLCYYRHPAKGYLARILQHTKASGNAKHFGMSVRPIMKMYANYSAVFGDAVTIRLFDRAHLRQGDVVADFLFEVGMDEVTISDLKKIEANVSGPAEVTAAQHLIRSRAFQDLDGTYARENRALNRVIYQASTGLGLGRARLKPGVAETVYFQNRKELRWLRSELGLVFDEIDYDSLDNPPTVDLNNAELSDLIQFDREKTDLIIARAIRELCNSAGVRNSLTSLLRRAKRMPRR